MRSNRELTRRTRRFLLGSRTEVVSSTCSSKGTDTNSSRTWWRRFRIRLNRPKSLQSRKKDLLLLLPLESRRKPFCPRPPGRTKCTWRRLQASLRRMVGRPSTKMRLLIVHAQVVTHHFSKARRERRSLRSEQLRRVDWIISSSFPMNELNSSSVSY